MIAMPGHRDILVGEAAWVMRGPVDINGAEAL
jgi:hypothetical protein